MAEIRLIRIFLSSPGDVADERALALKAIDQLPYDPFLRSRVAIEVVAWEKPGAGTPMLATMTPQEAINQGKPKPSECDIVVVIFWSRMGTPLPEEYDKPEEFRFPMGNRLPAGRYLSGTEWEYIDAVRAAKKVGRPTVVVYRRMEEPLIGVRDSERDEKIEQWKRVEAFFSTFVNPDGSIRQGYNQYQNPDEFQVQFESHLKGLVKRLMEEEPAPAETLPEKVSAEEITPLWKGSPFPGLRAFTTDDAPIFFGRGKETDELIRKVRENQFVAVVGASGSGKSSLVAAGLLPRLKDRAIIGSQDWLVPHMVGDEKREWTGLRFTPGEVSDNPFSALAVKLAPMVGQNVREVAEALASRSEQLGQLCQGLLTGQPEWVKVLLFIDQFEELFTRVREDCQRGAFIAMLVEIAQAKQVQTVVTLRADFYARCVEHEALAPLLRTGSFPLAAPGERALYEMIMRPVERAGLRWEEDDLPERILQDTGQEPGALPLMAYTLDELYQDCCQGDSGVLSTTAYEELGGVRGAIGKRAEKVFKALDEEAQQALPRIFRELVDVDERGTFTRKRALLGHVTDTEAKARLVNVLTQARLLVQSRGEEDQPVVEVAHEALFQHWKRLEDWLDEAREDIIILKNVSEDTTAWVARRRRPDDDGLYRGTVLEEKLTWVARTELRQDQQAFQDVLAFIDASQQHEIWVAEQERRRQRRYRLAWIGFAAVIMVSLIALLVYFYWQNGNLQTEVDVFEIRRARASTLIAGEVGYVPFGEGLSEQALFATVTKIAELNHWGNQDPVVDEAYQAQYGVEMVQVPAGCFWMGSVGGKSGERPVHEVCFDEPFWMDRYEVTNAKYTECVDAGGCDSLTGDYGDKFNGAQQPVVGVTWFQAEEYCAWRNAQLPTEAQWEYAARGPDSWVYPWGNEFVGDNGVYYENSEGQTAEVGEDQRPRGVSWVGVYDMSGNVSELVADWYGSYPTERQSDPPGPDFGDRRVVRGGSWDSLTYDLRAAYRGWYDPIISSDFNGFRCVRLR